MLALFLTPILKNLVDDLLDAVLMLRVLAQIEYAVGREFPHAGHCLEELLLVLFSSLLGSPERPVGVHVVLGSEVGVHHPPGDTLAPFVLAHRLFSRCREAGVVRDLNFPDGYPITRPRAA